MAKKTWHNVRLDEAAWQRLQLVHHLMVASHIEGRIVLESDNRDRFAVSQTIARLCDEYIDHRRRGKKGSRKDEKGKERQP